MQTGADGEGGPGGKAAKNDVFGFVLSQHQAVGLQYHIHRILDIVLGAQGIPGHPHVQLAGESQLAGRLTVADDHAAAEQKQHGLVPLRSRLPDLQAVAAFAHPDVCVNVLFVRGHGKAPLGVELRRLGEQLLLRQAKHPFHAGKLINGF